MKFVCGWAGWTGANSCFTKVLQKNGIQMAEKSVYSKDGEYVSLSLRGMFRDEIFERLQMTKNKKILRRKHDPFFRYIYAIPANTRTLLRLAGLGNPNLRKMLSTVDMETLELIPGSSAT